MEILAQENQTKAVTLLLKPDRLETPTMKRREGYRNKKPRNKEIPSYMQK